MIGRVAGTLVEKNPPQVVVLAGGVGYEIDVPMSTFYNLPRTGDRVELLTHLVVREDAHLLYGFLTAGERTAFRQLLKVSGVGPRIALAILSGVSVAAFARCVVEPDAAALTRIPGVGRKTAERLIVEMRDRVDAAGGLAAGGGVAAPPAGAEGEAFSALVALGYKPAEATQMLKGAGGGTTEERIRRALQGAARE